MLGISFSAAAVLARVAVARRLKPWTFACAVLGSVFGVSAEAHAFEQQWHLGAGGGFLRVGGAYRTGAAVNLYGAYGLSDMFDLRLELVASEHAAEVTAERPGQALFLWAASSMLTYKVDIIEWIPYIGVSLSYVGFSEEPLESLRRHDAALGMVAGLDYALSRDFGLGVQIRSDDPLGASGSGSFFGALFRAEYHWGY